MFQTEDRPKHVGFKRRGKAIRGLRCKRARFAFGACAVDGNIDTPEASESTVDQTLDVLFAADIGCDERNFDPFVTERSFESTPLCFTASGYHDIRAGIRKSDGSCPANALERASDKNHLITHRFSPHDSPNIAAY
jgi:hypothetical protein